MFSTKIDCEFGLEIKIGFMELGIQAITSCSTDCNVTKQLRDTILY